MPRPRPERSMSFPFVGLGLEDPEGIHRSQLCSLDLDDLQRFLLANLPDGIAGNEPLGIRQPIRDMALEEFFDLCEDVCEEMTRRNNQLRDGVVSLFERAGSRLGRNKRRKRLSELTAGLFNDFCRDVCIEISRRSKHMRATDKFNSAFGGSRRTSGNRVSAGLGLKYTGASSTRNMNYSESFNMERGLADLGIKQDIYFELAMFAISDILSEIFRDQPRYKALLSYRGDTAQNVLDLLRLLLDYPSLSISVRHSLLLALVRLSQSSGLYPRCYSLKGIDLEGSPVTAGHFGEIWKGNFLEKSVCLKVVKLYQRSQVDHLLKAFSKEAIVWGHVSHPNLLPFYGVYHFPDARGRICLVSPWMENGNVRDYLDLNPDACRLLLLSDIAHGLQYLHYNDIVHGDLKGANILINASGRACLADFGLSSVLDNEASRWTSNMSTIQRGTVRWQAPELMDPDYEDARVSKASDVYAFACVCYEVLTDRDPFYQVIRDATVILKVMRGVRPSLPVAEDPSWLRGLTDKTWKLMEDCWHMESSERPSMSKVIDMLPLDDVVDKRSIEYWEDDSPCWFRNAMHGGEYISATVLETVISWL